MGCGGSRWVVRASPAIHCVAWRRASLHPLTSIQQAGVGVSIRGECSVVMAHERNCKQSYDNGGGTSDRVIVVVAFPVVLVSVIYVGIVVALRVAGVVHMFDVLGDLLGPVGRRRQIIRRDDGRRLTHRHRRRMHADANV